VRTYVPDVGRFLQTDPILGGSATDYDYVNQEPINNYDLSGRACFWKWFKKAVKKAIAPIKHPNRYAKIGAAAGIVGIGCGLSALATGGTALIACVGPQTPSGQ
jgi:hypothetical protein